MDCRDFSVGARSALNSKVTLQIVSYNTTACKECLRTFGAFASPLLRREGTQTPVSVLAFEVSMALVADYLKVGRGFTVIRCVAARAAACCKVRTASLAAHCMNVLTSKIGTSINIAYPDPVLWPLR